MKILSSAKVNLNLTINSEVIQGLHTLSSLMIPISLFDEIQIREIDSEDDIIQFHPENLIKSESTIHKALQYLREENNFTQKFHIIVNKNIPIEAGLGGGSSDAGSIIKFLITKYNLLTPNFSKIASNIGSDVPFFINGSAAKVSGFGEKINPVKIEDSMYLLIATPHEKLSTSKVFEEFDKQPNTLKSNVSIQHGIEIKNNLWNASLNIEPKLLEHKEYLERIIDYEFFMSGTGTTLFCLGKEKQLKTKIQNIDNARFRLIALTKKIHCSLLQEAD